MWGATCAPYHNRGLFSNFNPRAPCGARQPRPTKDTAHRSISIHAPRVGRDISLPASPGGPRISIHAPRVGRDKLRRAVRRCKADFNPRAPCGARRLLRIRPSWMRLQFQSTRPVWGATRCWPSISRVRVNFNPRAPCGARRLASGQRSMRWEYFNPRAPCGARRYGNQ